MVSKNTFKMLKQLLPLTVLMLFAFQSFAQTPTPIRKDFNPDGPESVVCIPGSVNDAGTITIDPNTHVGSSNDVDGDPIYLCENDLISIDHDAGTQNLTGDPVSSTTPGVGYIFYTCPPSATFDGDLLAIENDPCVLTIGGQIVVFPGFDTSGDVDFINLGALQDFYNGGDPVQFWFAPITYDQLDLTTNPGIPTAVYEGTPTGPCVDVNHDELFSVIYLNEIETSNVQNTRDGSSCLGSFDLTGGLPEFDTNGLEEYDISITLASDPSIQGDIFGTVTSTANNDPVEFSVTTPGLYNVTISDGKGCPHSFQVDMSGCNAINVNIPDVTALPGEEICVPVTVEDFTDIASVQFSLAWDNSIIQLTDTNYIAPLDENFVFFGNFDPMTSNSLVVSILDPSLAPITLPDGASLFEICFTVVGPNGSSSPIEIVGSPTPIDVFDGSQPGPTGLGVAMGIIINNGSVTAITTANFNTTVDPTDISCGGLMDGSFDVTIGGIAGSTEPYSIAWTNSTTGATGTITGVNNGQMVSETGLAAGTYNLIITDSSTPPQSEVVDPFDIEDPGPLIVNISPMEPNCNGGTDGTLTANVSIGGVTVADLTGYTFNWSPGGATTQVLSNYIPGTVYTVDIVSPNNCMTSDQGAGTTPAPLDITFVKTDATCAGVDDGEITATPSGGVAGTSYNYNWSNGTNGATASTIDNLPPGTYTLTITDDNMCTYEEEIIVGSATVINAIGAETDVQCFGADNGSITMMPTVTGTSNGPFSYQWSNNIPASNTTATANGLSADFYSVTVSDPAGCIDTTSFTINEPTQIVIDSVVVTPETCLAGGSNGTATVFTQGGTVAGNYTYNWNCCPTATTDMATGIAAGTYTVIVLDDNLCSQAETFTINPPTPPSMVMFDSVSVSCPNSTNGELTANFTAGNGTNHNFVWSNGGMTQTITGLSPGDYTVTISDEFGCTVEETTSLWAPAPLSVTPIPTNPLCNGENTGVAAVQVTGSTGPYSYIWSANANNSTLQVVPTLAAGTYTVTVSDANNCEQVPIEVVLQDPEAITIVVNDITPVSCFGLVSPNCDGQATALASGGGSGSILYNYNWDSGEVEAGVVSSTAAMLCQGMNTVVVSDANNCSSTFTFEVPTPDPLTIDDAIYTPPLCNGDANGSIQVEGDGGQPSYQYLWDDMSTDATRSGIPAGTYTVTITDDNGCVFDTTLFLTEPEVLVASIDLDNTNNISCSGNSDGQITATYMGGNAIDFSDMSYIWSNGATTSQVTDLPPGTYTVTLSDQNGCTDIATYSINEPPAIIANIPQPEEPLCFGFQTFMTVESASGGNGGPFSFSVDGGPTQAIGTQIPVFAGTHTVTVFDTTGACGYEEEILINQPPEVIVDLGPDIEIQLGETAQLNAVLGGSVVPIDSIIWTPLDSLSCVGCLNPVVSPIDGTTYNVQIFNTDGCTGSDDIFVDVDKNRNVFIPNAFTPNGDGFNDFFQVFTGPGVTNVNSIIVFDRWGEVVYSAQNISPTPFPDSSNGWDGKMNGRIMNPGVFVYLIEVEFDDRVTLLFRGDVTLMH